MASSLCTAKAIRAYFRNGTMPEEGTICEIESQMFGSELSPFAVEFEGEDRVLMRTWRTIGRKFQPPQIGSRLLL